MRRQASLVQQQQAVIPRGWVIIGLAGLSWLAVGALVHAALSVGSNLHG